MKTRLTALIFTSAALFTASANAQSWNLANDWNPPANPNDAWTYGGIVNGTFTPLAYVPATQSYGAQDGSSAFFWKNTSANPSFPAYGIDPGQISMECDWGTPALLWTAPAAGYYNIAVAIGGTEDSENGGFGNYNASASGLNINGVGQAGSLSDNVNSWTFDNYYLNAGDTVEAYVPQRYVGGNTQAQFTVTTSVPEPASLTLVGLTVSSILARRKIR